jgi:transposase
MDVTTIGLDLAKNIFQVHGVDREGRVIVARRLRRNQMQSFFAGLRPCLVGMEACPTAHYRGRELRSLGHEVPLIPPQYVKPYVRRSKNDAADAAAICEAVARPSMRFVPIKDEAQQAALMLHRGREFAAWLGLVPRQNSSAGKARLGKISKQGNEYVRRLLIIGAQAALLCSKEVKANPWVQSMLARRPRMVVAVALANKMARIAWTLMSRRTQYGVAAAA